MDRTHLGARRRIARRHPIRTAESVDEFVLGRLVRRRRWMPRLRRAAASSRSRRLAIQRAPRPRSRDEHTYTTLRIHLSVGGIVPLFVAHGLFRAASRLVTTPVR